MLPALTSRTSPTRRSNCTCVWPQTTTSAPAPVSGAAQRSSGLSRVKISSSLRGVAWQKSVRPTVSVSGSERRNSTSSGESCARTNSISSGGASPGSCWTSSRSALPRMNRTSPSSERSRPIVSAGHGPRAKSPPTTMTSASTSASTASSAGRFPWMSYSAATRKELIHDLELHAPALACTARTHDRAQRAGDPSLPADHLAEVVLGDVEAQDDGVVLVDTLDANLVGFVDELARQELE